MASNDFLGSSKQTDLSNYSYLYTRVPSSYSFTTFKHLTDLTISLGLQMFRDAQDLRHEWAYPFHYTDEELLAPRRVGWIKA